MNDLRIRGVFIQISIGLLALIYISRLFYLQVLSEDYALEADQKELKEVVLRPSRGIIYDRNERIYVQNSPIFDVMIVPRELHVPDTSLLLSFLELSKDEFVEKLEGYSALESYKPQILKKQISNKEATRLMENLWGFKGIFLESKNTREYLYPAGANFLGYINQVRPSDLESDEYYGKLDLIGISGLESMYEKALRGEKGQKIILVDAFDREVARYAGGASDLMPEEGNDLRIGIDATLQEFGETLMQNKRGSIVAIEPSSGEILSFVSAPSYDPNLFTGGKIGKHYKELAADTSQRPLFNRPLMAMYPPGSIFKILQTLAALSEGVVTEHTRFPCHGAWFRNRGKPDCHGAHGAVPLSVGIQHSCNAYFAETYYQFMNAPKFENIHEAYQRWWEIMTDYGVGRKLGIDIPNERSGFLPKGSYYSNIYGKNSWSALTIYSNSIGQGEVLMTPVQMANMAAMIANRGWYITPHFLDAVKDDSLGWVRAEFDTVRVPGTPEHFEFVVNAMQEVVERGTARRARIDSIEVCGKTGTVENKPYPDHSVFICFAPRENPRIAVGVIVENAGYGGTWAAPIASLMIEKYLTGEVDNEFKLNRILEADFREVEPIEEVE